MPLELLSLTRANLTRLDSRVHLPRYDPAQVRAGIVHLGLGGFHRAHMARYTHDLMQRRPDALGWGIVGAGLLPADRRMADSLLPQDALLHSDRTRCRRRGRHHHCLIGRRDLRG